MSIEVKAQNDLPIVSVKVIYDAVNVAQESAENAQSLADQAQDSADQAKAQADIALSNAQNSTSYANNALGQLSEIEKVVDALNWIAKHGQYAVTDDTEVVAGKWYFELQGGEYVLVTPNAGDNPHILGYYELTGVDEAISNYVGTHLALTPDGLFVQIDDNACKLQISSTGIYLYDASGNIIATYSSIVRLGNPNDPNGIHITLSPTNGLGFYQGKEDVNDASVNRVAYISSNKLFIKQAEITNAMRIGKFVWKVQSANRISLIYSPLN